MTRGPGALRIEARPGAMRLLADAKAGKIRRCRRLEVRPGVPRHAGPALVRIRARGRGIDRVHSVKDNIPEGQFRNVMVAITGHQAQQERRGYSRKRSMAGVKARVASGKLIPGNKPDSATVALRAEPQGASKSRAGSRRTRRRLGSSG